MDATRSRLLTFLPALAAISACHSSPSSEGSALVDVRVLRSSPVSKVVLTVESRKLGAPLVRTLAPSGRQYATLITGLPPSADYTFTAVAYDTAKPAQPVLRGSVEGQTIVAGQTANIIITLNQIQPPPPQQSSTPIIDSVSASTLVVSAGGRIQLQTTAHDPDPGDTARLVFNWTATCGVYAGTSTTPGDDDNLGRSEASYLAPGTHGVCSLALLVLDPAGHSTSISFNVTVGEFRGTSIVEVSLDGAPDVSGMFATPGQMMPGLSITLTIAASDPDGHLLDYTWTSTCPGMFSTSSSDTTTFTLDGDSDRPLCHFDVVVEDRQAGTEGARNQTFARFGVGVGAIPIVLPPQFGLVSQSRDSIADGETVMLAATAADPAGGEVTYTWTSSAGGAPTATAPQELGFDSASFAVAAIWSAPAATSSEGMIVLKLAATSSTTSLTSHYHFLLLPADSPCVTLPIVCGDLEVCDPRTSACASHVPGNPFPPTLAMDGS